MKPASQRFLRISLFLNLALIAATGYALYLLQHHPTAALVLPEPLAGNQSNPRSLPPPSAFEAPALVKTNSPKFDWGQIESADYAVYIANLRAIHCPEQTICDIITADINALYENRKAALLPDSLRVFKYWETPEHHRLPRLQADEIAKGAAALDAEKKAVLQELLGGGCQQNQITVGDANSDSRLSFLSAEQQLQARAIEDRYPGLNDKIRAIVDAGSTTNQPADVMQSLQLHARRKAELVQLLGTNNYELYDLSTSWSADNVRKGLSGFNPTEDEFRAIFDVWRAQDENLATIYATGQPDPGIQGVNDAIHAILGDDRFQQYIGAWGNDNYHETAELAYDYGLPSDIPDQLYNLRQQTQAQQQQLLSDPNLTDAQRTSALQALQAQTIQSTAQQLGPAYQTYLQSGGNWIQNIVPAVQQH